jgi:o-succinylbenzoate---CoA ligase
LTSAARERPGHPAVVAAGETLSYAELEERARATTLPPLHATTTPAGPDFAVELHAAWLGGTAIAPLRKKRGPSPFLHPPEGTLAVIFTSGSTGEPRGVCLTRANFEASARAGAAVLPVEPDDRWLCCLPVHHVAGLSIFTRCAIFGATVVAEPFKPDRVKTLMESGEVTIASLVPTMLLRLRDAGLERTPKVHGILLGGGPIPTELLDWALDVGLPIMPTYGMTETTSQIATAEVGQRLARPLPGVELQIADDDEILVRGPMVAADGWLHTGDRGRLTADGLLEVHGRMDDVIVTGGENVAAREVVDAVRSHPGVTDAAVIGVEDEEWGRAIWAFVAGEVAERDVVEHCRGLLPGFKVPKRVVVLDELPRTASGKVERPSLESRAHDLRQRR